MAEDRGMNTRRDKYGFKAVSETRVEHRSGWVIEHRDGRWRIHRADGTAFGSCDTLNEAKGVALFYMERAA